MIVLVLAVVGFWAVSRTFTDAARDQRTAGQSQSADWESAVRAVQDGGDDGLTPIYPRRLPDDDWYANTDPTYTSGTEPAWQMAFVKGETHYVGLRQATADEFDLVQEKVDPDADKGDDVTVDTEVADEWTSWTDDGGDYALTTEVDGQTLIVWGTGEDDVRTFLDLLTTEPLD